MNYFPLIFPRLAKVLHRGILWNWEPNWFHSYFNAGKLVSVWNINYSQHGSLAFLSWWMWHFRYFRKQRVCMFYSFSGFWAKGSGCGISEHFSNCSSVSHRILISRRTACSKVTVDMGSSELEISLLESFLKSLYFTVYFVVSLRQVTIISLT